MPTKLHAEMTDSLLRTDVTTQSISTSTVFANIGVNLNFPIGMTMLWPNTSGIPYGWFACNGASKSTTSYPDLFAAMGYTFGGSGANFNLPTLTAPTNCTYIVRAFNYDKV